MQRTPYFTEKDILIANNKTAASYDWIKYAELQPERIMELPFVSNADNSNADNSNADNSTPNGANMNYLRLPPIITRFALAAVATACFTVSISAQEAAPDAAAAQRAAEELNRRPDSVGTGPFPAMKEQIAALPEHVVYRPRDLAALGSQKLGSSAYLIQS